MSIAAPAIPPNPSKPATKAIIKKVIDQRNIGLSPVVMIKGLWFKCLVQACEPSYIIRNYKVNELITQRVNNVISWFYQLCSHKLIQNFHSVFVLLDKLYAIFVPTFTVKDHWSLFIE